MYFHHFVTAEAMHLLHQQSFCVLLFSSRFCLGYSRTEIVCTQKPTVLPWYLLLPTKHVSATQSATMICVQDPFFTAAHHLLGSQT